MSRALDCLTLALKHDPRHVEAHYNLGNLYFDAGDLRLAKLHYETAAALEPSFAPLHFNAALVHYRLGDLSEACQSLQRYKDLAPEDGEIAAIDELLKWLERARDLATKR
jgi:tetratricopeptide (TPR) repeat protein